MFASKNEHRVQPNYNATDCEISCSVHGTHTDSHSHKPAVHEAEPSATDHAILSVRLQIWWPPTPTVNHIHQTHSYLISNPSPNPNPSPDPNPNPT